MVGGAGFLERHLSNLHAVTVEVDTRDRAPYRWRA